MICSTAFNVLVIIWTTDYVRIIHLCWFIVLSAWCSLVSFLLNLYLSLEYSELLYCVQRSESSEAKKRKRFIYVIEFLKENHFDFIVGKRINVRRNVNLLHIIYLFIKTSHQLFTRGCKTTKETAPVRQGPEGEMKQAKRNKLLTFIIAITKP